jgi:sterol 3beta-glucosyltransferase
MRIGIQTWGTHGDIRPFIALAEGLQSSGHQVSLIVTSIDDIDYRKAISKEGVNFSQIASPVIQDKTEYIKVEKSLLNEKKPIKQAKIILSTAFLPVEKSMYEAAEKLCQNNDIVIGHYFHYPVQTAAEKTGTPYVSVVLTHSMLATINHPPVRMPRLGKWGNKFFWWLMRAMFNKHMKPYADNLRTQQGLEPAKDLISDVWSSRILNLVAVSPEICQPQNDWSENIQVCGFLNMPNISAEGRFSEELENFLNDGAPPVYMNFGSMVLPVIEIQEETIQLFTETVKIANCRAIIQMPLWKECQVASSRNSHYVSSAPHNLIFQRCAAVVHHGGAGTTQTATLAGVPSIVVAHFDEQGFWGLELKRLGIAPNPLLRRKVTSRNLAESIKTVVNSPTMHEKAKAIGQAMKNENGVRKAVELINRKFKA